MNMGREMEELKSYMKFQEAILWAAQEVEAPPKPFIPSGCCSKHGQRISNGMFDGVCNLCEAEQDEAAYEYEAR